MTDCRNCRRDTDTFLCMLCQNELDGLLAELPWLLEQLEITLVRQDRLSIGAIGHSSDNPSPINVGAMELSRNLTGLLGTLVRELCEQRAMHTPVWPVGKQSRAAALWLAINVNAIACSDTAGQTFVDIRNTRDNLVAAINRSSRMYCGPCLTTLEDEEQCGADIYADREALEDVQCPRCKTWIDPQKQVLAWAATARGDLLTEAQIFDALEFDGAPVPADVLKRWLYRGRLKIRGYIGDDGQITPKRRGDDARVYSLAQARQLRGGEWQTYERRTSERAEIAVYFPTPL